MRILHVSHQYPPAIGGAERHIANISEELTRRGHQVDVFTTRSTDYQTWRGSLPRCEELGGVKVYRFGCFKRGRLTWQVLRRGLGGYQRTRSAWYTPFIIWGNGPISPSMIWRLLRSGRQYDLIHVNSLHYAPVSYVYLVARCLGVPFAVTPFVHIDQPAVFDIRFQNAIIRNADLVLAMTDREKDYLSARGVPGDRVTVAGSGICLEDYPQLDSKLCRRRLGLPQESFLLLFLGRKEKYKGLETLLVAFERVQAECPDLFLVAAGGETDYSRRLRERFSGLDRIVFLNRVSEQVKLELLNACDLFALPSVGESFGIVYIEAWAVGKAVIGANSGAVTSVISHGVDGLLVAPERVGDLAIKIVQCYRDRELGQRLAAAGYLKAATRYTVESVTDVIEGAYLRTLRRRNNARRQQVQSSRGELLCG